MPQILPGIKTVTDFPMEQIHVTADLERIDAYHSNLKDFIKMLDSGDFHSFHYRETRSHGFQGYGDTSYL
jgi:hypothetical protein